VWRASILPLTAVYLIWGRQYPRAPPVHCWALMCGQVLATVVGPRLAVHGPRKTESATSAAALSGRAFASIVQSTTEPAPRGVAAPQQAPGGPPAERAQPDSRRCKSGPAGVAVALQARQHVQAAWAHPGTAALACRRTAAWPSGEARAATVQGGAQRRPPRGHKRAGTSVRLAADAFCATLTSQGAGGVASASAKAA